MHEQLAQRSSSTPARVELVDLFRWGMNNSPCLLRGGEFPTWQLIEVMEPHVDQLIAELAARQHGVVSWRQLLALGLGRDAIEHS